MFNWLRVVKKKYGAVEALSGRMCAMMLVFCAGFSGLSPAFGDSESPLEPRARLADESPPGGSHAQPVELDGGTVLTFVAPERLRPLAARISVDIRETHAHFTGLFGDIPRFETSVHIMESASFYALTGAPPWTNALYLRGQIILPVSLDEPLDFENITRSVRHEYTHAVNAALSGNRSPGWIDEGLAQYHEGEQNPLLFQALSDWLEDNRPVPFRLLLGGFTKLDTAMVPAAYAQSLVASSSIVRLYGYRRLRTYFDGLRSGADRGVAFREAFGISEDLFEQRLGKTMIQAARESFPHHHHAHRPAGAEGLQFVSVSTEAE